MFDLPHAEMADVELVEYRERTRDLRKTREDLRRLARRHAKNITDRLLSVLYIECRRLEAKHGAGLARGEATKRAHQVDLIPGRSHTLFMPRVATIGNVEIYMYADDHRPIHVHVYMGTADDAKVGIGGNIIEGKLSKATRKTSVAWVLANVNFINARWKELGNI